MEDRIQVRTSASWGEQLREYRARPTTTLLDVGVAHQYFVLAQRLDGPMQDIHAISPLAETEVVLGAGRSSLETIEVEGETVETTLLVIGQGDEARSVWFDTSGRLVRVSHAASGFLAQRRLDS